MSALFLLAAVYTSTLQVDSLAAGGGAIWAATAGGVEEYAPGASRRTRLYTTEDGLDANDVRGIWFDGQVHVRTERSTCTLGLHDAGDAPRRFRCEPARARALQAPGASPRFHGARETARLQAFGRTLVGTTAGLWSNDQALSPPGQICGNHLEALAEFQGRLWVGAFDGGLCSFDGARFIPAALPARMINDLLVVGDTLWIAAAEGLFSTKDGRRFQRTFWVRDRGVNRLAADGRWLYATTPGALWAVRLGFPQVVRRWRKPAGSTSLQAVAVSGRDLWLASEDLGAIRMRAGRFESFDRSSGLPSSWLTDVAPAAGGGVWAASLRHGLVRLSPQGEVVERPALPDAWMLRLTPDGAGLLVGTQGGLGQMTKGAASALGDGLGQMTKSPTPSPGWTAIAGLPDPRVHALLRTADGLWVGTEGGLLFLPRPEAQASADRRP